MRRLLVALSLLLASGAPWSLPGQSFNTRWEAFKRRLSNEDLYRLLWVLPKGGDIHNHHEYSVPMSFWIDGATERNYYTRIKVSDCGEEWPLMWLILRKESVDKLPACQQGDFASAAALNDSQRRAWLSALTLDKTESKEEFFEGIVRRLGDVDNDPHLMAEALILAQKQLQEQNALYLETQLDPRSFWGVNADEGADVIRRRLAQADSVKTGVVVW